MKQILLKSVTVKAVKAGSKAVKNELGKQTVLKFTNQKQANGTFKRNIRLTRVPKNAEDKQRGILHKTAGLRNRLQGDVPSLTRKLNSQVKKGRFGAKALQRSYKAAKTTGKAALEVENLLILTKDVVSPRKKIQFTITRVMGADGKTKTHIDVDHINRNERHQRGIIHRAVAERRGFKSHFKGDTFSLTKKLDSVKPKTVKGAVLLSAGKGAYRYAKFAVHTTENAAMGAENVALFARDRAVAHFDQKFRSETENSGDTGNAVIKTGGLIVKGANGIRRYSSQKRNYKYEKNLLKKYKDDKKDNFNKLYNTPVFQKKFFPWVEIRERKDKLDLKAAKQKIKATKKPSAQDKKNVRELKKEVHRNNLMYKMQKDRAELQKRVVRREKPVPLAFQPGVHAVKSAAASGWNKAVNSDANNDVMKAADKAVSLLKNTGAAAGQISHFANKQQAKLYDKSITSEKKSAFKKSNSAFKKKGGQTSLSSPFKKNWKKWKNPNGKNPYKSFGDFVKDTVKAYAKAFRKSLKSTAIGAVSVLLPVLCFLLCFVMVGYVIMGIFQNSAFILGSYQAKDKDLSEAAVSYTKLAYELNEAVLKCGNKNSWRGGLTSTKKANGYDLIKYHDIPDNFIYGRNSTFLNYEPADYDFDPYVLWSFLCAYNYDFKESEKAKNEGKQFEPDYWTFDSKNKDIVKKLFENEYKFEFYYDNQSRWEKRSPYKYWGGGSGSGSSSYYRADKTAHIYDGQPYRYRFKPIAITSELSKYKDSEGYICINNDYRVLDPNNNYALTGFMIMDNRYYSGSKKPFYYHNDSTDVYWFHHGEDHDRSSWGWECTDGSGNKYWVEAWFLISPTDAHIWNSDINDTCLYGYYEKYVWKTDCRFYYVVTQNGSFKENAIKLLEESDPTYKNERVTYFKALLGQDDDNYYGNHQLFGSPVYTSKNIHEILAEGKIYNNYGYDIQQWNSKHCSLSNHKGIDISCGVNTDVHSVIDGEITAVDTVNHKIAITTDSEYNFWYDDKKNKVRVTFENVQIKSGLSVGSKVKANDIIGKVTNDRNCENKHNDKASTSYLHIKIEGGKNNYYDVIDPMLSIY